MRAQQANGRRIIAAGFSPTEFGIDDIALQAIGRTEVLADLRRTIEFVLRDVFRHPVATVVSEVELLSFRMPGETDTMPHAERIDLGAGAVQIHPADLAMGVVMQDVVAGLPDLNIKLVVGADG